MVFLYLGWTTSDKRRAIHTITINEYNYLLDTISGTLPTASCQGRMHRFLKSSLALFSPYCHISSLVLKSTVDNVVAVVTSLSYFVNKMIAGSSAWPHFIPLKRSQNKALTSFLRHFKNILYSGFNSTIISGGH